MKNNMSSKDNNRFEILSFLAVAGNKGYDINDAAQTALRMASEYVGLNAAALYLWDDKYKVNVSVTHTLNDEYKERIERMEEDLFKSLRKDKQLVSAYMSFGGKPMIHSFTLPLSYGDKIFGAVIGLQEGERKTVSEDKLLESFTALLALNYAASEKQSSGEISNDILDKERLNAILSTAVTVNHEVNNPLTAILGNIQLLLMNKEGLDKELKAKLKTIEASALKIKDVTQRLMRMTSPRTVEYDNGTKMIDIYGDDDADNNKNNDK